MISSAVVSIIDGMVSPSAFAVFRLTTRSNLRLVKTTPSSNPFAAACCSAFVEPGLEVLQGLDALSYYWVIHASSPLWCDIPSKSVCFVIVDDADRLHPGVDDDGSHELETALSHGI